MKILYIDHISPYGHVNFNTIHLQSLLSLNHHVYCIFKKDYFKKISVENIKIYLELPLWLYKKYWNGFTERILYFSQLLFIKFKVKFKTFDIVIFASYEPISLFFANIKCPLLLINHNTISGLDKSKVKEFFTKSISNRNVHIVFNEYMKQRLLLSKIHNVVIVPHGFIKPFIIDQPNNVLNSFTDIDYKIFNLHAYSIVFCPSSASIDKIFLFQLLFDKGFNEFLIERNIILVLKGNIYLDQNFCRNIVCIDRRFSDIEYQKLFFLSKIILLLYDNNYKYRTSGVLFECFSNNKPCLVLQNESINSYSKYFNYDPFFDTVSELSDKVLWHQQHVFKNHSLYTNLKELNPISYWDKLLSQYN